MKQIVTLIFMFISMMVFSQNTPEMNLIKEVNQLRSNPKAYINYVQDFKVMKSKFKSNVDWYKVCDETIEYLKTLNSVDTLTFNESYFNKLDTFKFNGQHTMLFPKSGSENLSASSDIESAREIVLYLLTDARVKDKGHRLNLMNPDFKSTAVKTYSYDNMTYFVQIFTN